MFTKVLIAEDFQDTNQGIVNALKEELKISEIQDESFCDKAYNRLLVAVNMGKPFQLLITDLSFKEGTLSQKLHSGYELVRAARELQPDLKVIVNSMIDDPVQIKNLFDELRIDAYVCKGRQSLNELIHAVGKVYNDETYISSQIDMNLAANVFELDEMDLFILKELSNGFKKKEIRSKLQKAQLKPNSESAIDKRVSKLFVAFHVRNTTHLVAKLTREGVI